jgi:Domain of unknown function (DUF4190)
MTHTNKADTTATTDVEEGHKTTPTAVAVEDPVIRKTTTPAQSFHSGPHSGPKNSCMANASLVCGIVGLFIFGVILGTLAIIFGCIAKGNIQREPERYGGKCQANAGLTLGIIGLVLWVIILILVASG